MADTSQNLKRWKHGEFIPVLKGEIDRMLQYNKCIPDEDDSHNISRIYDTVKQARYYFIGKGDRKRYMLKLNISRESAITRIQAKENISKHIVDVYDMLHYKEWWDT